MKYFFSIIIPCYNSFQYMTLGLTSLEKQSFRDFEVILIDDCSSDDTYDKLQDFRKKTSLNIKLIRNEINSGPGESRNKGIALSKGKYIAFMDSDDYYEVDYLKEMHEAINSEDIDIVQCDFYRCYNGKKYWIKCTKDFDSLSSKEDLIAQMVSSLWVLVIKRELLRNVPIPHLYNAEDVIVIPLLIAAAQKVSFVHKPLYNYAYRPCSLSTQKSERISESFIKGYGIIKKELAEQYVEASQFIGIKMILYAAVYNAIRANINSHDLFQIIDPWVKENKKWFANKYLNTLPMRKVLFVYASAFHCFRILRIYCKMHELLLNRK